MAAEVPAQTNSARIEDVVSALLARHPRFAPVTVRRWVAEAFERHRTAKVQTYLPVLVQREIAARLQALDDERPVVDVREAAVTTLRA